MRLIEKRVGLLFAAFTLAFLLVLFRAGWLQAVRGGELSADARSQQVASVTVPGMRGAILDRRGNALAISEEAATIFATPYQVEDKPKAAKKLADLLDEPEDEILETLSAPDSGFEYIAHKVDLVTAERIRKLDLAGIGTLPDSRRVYPQDKDGARMVGAVGAEGEGLWGIEAAQDEVLAGTDGEVAITKDALGQEISRDVTQGTEAGHDVQLTIDGRIQAYTESVLADVGEKHDADSATAITMNPETGEILSMASWPPVDPNDLSDADGDLLSNMATAYTYEPGSTFKAFTVAGALEDGVVKPHTSFELGPSIQVADRTIEEAHEGDAYGTLDVGGILAHSSNVGAVMIGLQLGEKPFDRWVHRFGFGTPTGIEYPGEEMGIVPTADEYSGSSIGNLPIGQGLSVTPIQMMSAYAAIANGGTLRPPQLIEAVDGEPVPPPAGKQILSEETSAEVRSMLEGVLGPFGTAEVEVPGYVLAGKTGTAQKVVDGTYSETQYIPSFVGFAPAADPKLLVSVVVDEPKGGDYYGGTVAAPVFGQIASFALPYLGIAPTE